MYVCMLYSILCFDIQGISKKGKVDYFTDVSKYTGMHKERFDEEGKGKGKAGREDVYPSWYHLVKDIEMEMCTCTLFV